MPEMNIVQAILSALTVTCGSLWQFAVLRLMIGFCQAFLSGFLPVWIDQFSPDGWDTT